MVYTYIDETFHSLSVGKENENICRKCAGYRSCFSLDPKNPPNTNKCYQFQDI